MAASAVEDKNQASKPEMTLAIIYAYYFDTFVVQKLYVLHAIFTQDTQVCNDEDSKEEVFNVGIRIGGYDVRAQNVNMTQFSSSR